MTERQRRKPYAELKKLPPVFLGRDFEIGLGYTPAAAQVALHRWTAAGYLARAGKRAGIYYNLVVDPDAASTRVGEAIALQEPSAIAVGATALHQHGWTTQIPRVRELAIPAHPNVRSRPQLEGVSFAFRTPEWYGKAAPAAKPGVDGLPTLPPALALADAALFGGVWKPDPDDLDVPWEEDAEREIRDAFRSFGDEDRAEAEIAAMRAAADRGRGFGR